MPTFSRRAAILAGMALAGCTSSPDPGPIRAPGMAPLRLAVSGVEVQDQVQGLPLNFIDRRRSEEMLAVVRDHFKSGLQATGGSDVARVTVEDASLVEQPIPRGGITGAVAGPAKQLVGSLAVKIAVVDGSGIERSFARAKVGLKRPVGETASVVERDRLARDMVNDLLAQLDSSLQASMRENLGAYMAVS